jgi:hypothetical protein
VKAKDGVSQRRFGVLDGMILIAMTGAGFAWCLRFEAQTRRAQAEMMALSASPDDSVTTEYASVMPPPPDARAGLSLRVGGFFRFFSFLLTTWTVAFLLIRLRRPRPPMAEVASSCATSAAVTVFVLTLANVIRMLSEWIGVYALDGKQLDLEFLMSGLEDRAASAIAATWMTLWLIRKLHVEKHWIEVFGLVLAGGWVILYCEPFAYPIAGWFDR